MMMREGKLIYEGAWNEQRGDLEKFYMEEFE